MISIPVLQEELDLALADAGAMGHLQGSILQGSGNWAGFIGELAVARYLGYLGAKRQNTKNHDLVVHGWTFDVKTKRRSCVPLKCYQATVSERSIRQDCHAYIFTSVMFAKDIPQTIHLCGWLPKRDFMNMSSQISKGDRFPENNWVCSEDCRVVPYSSLRDMFDLEANIMLRKGWV